MSMTKLYTITLFAVLAAIFFLILPNSPYMNNNGWGYYPSAFIVLVALALGIVTLRALPRRHS